MVEIQRYQDRLQRGKGFAFSNGLGTEALEGDAANLDFVLEPSDEIGSVVPDRSVGMGGPDKVVVDVSHELDAPAEPVLDQGVQSLCLVGTLWKSPGTAT